MAFSGDLVLMPPPELLGFLGRHSQSGRLTLDRGDGKTLSLHLEEGQVHCALFPAIDSGRSGRIAITDQDAIFARAKGLLPKPKSERLRRKEFKSSRKIRRPTRRCLLIEELRRSPVTDREARLGLVEKTVLRALLWSGGFRFTPGPLPAWLLDAVLNDETWTRSAEQLALDGARYRDDSSRFNRADFQALLAAEEGNAPATLQGDLSGIGLAGVFESLQKARRSGTLEVGDAKFSADIVFFEGRVFVMRREAGDATESWASEILDEGGASWSDVEEQVTGCVHEDELADDVRSAVREPLFALLVQDEAHFRFVENDLPQDFEVPAPGTARVELHGDRFLMEAIQKLTEWDAVRRLVRYREALRFPDPLCRKELLVNADAGTAELLTLIDGARTFGQLLRSASIGRLEAGRMVRLWIEAGVLQVER